MPFAPTPPFRFAGWRAVVLSSPVLAWAAHFVLVHSTAAVTVALTPERARHRPRLGGIGEYVVAPLAVWDGGWYGHIARHGYGQQQEAAAFWPLYPWLTRAVSRATEWGPEVSGLVLSNVAFLAALVALERLVSNSYDPTTASKAVWLTALCPVSFFFSAFYTESVFLALSAGSVTLARRGRWTGAALAAFLATLTRSTGLLVLLPLGIAFLGQGRGWVDRQWRPGLQIAAACAGPLVFAAHLDRLWGDPLLMVRAQEH